MNNVETLFNLMVQLRSPENDVRKNAEKVYFNWSAQNLHEVLDAHIKLLDSSVSPDVRNFSSILLPRLIYRSKWVEVGDNTKEILRNAVCNIYLTEQDSSVLRNLANIISILSGYDPSWSGPDELIIHYCQSNELRQRENGFTLLSSLGVISERLEKYMDDILQSINECLSPEAPHSLILQVLKGYSNVVFSTTDWKRLNPIFPKICALIKGLVTVDEDVFTECFKVLVEIAMYACEFYKTHIETLIGLTSGIVTNTELEWNTRELLVEIFCCLAETLPTFIKRQKHLTQFFIRSCMQIACEVEDDDLWNTRDGSEELDTGKARFVQDSIELFSHTVGLKNVKNIIINDVPVMLSNNDWKVQYGCFISLGPLVVGNYDKSCGVLQPVMNFVLSFVQNNNPRVLFAVLDTIEHLSFDTEDDLQDNYSEVLLQLFTKLISEQQPLPLLGKLASTIDSFCHTESIEEDILDQYSSILLTNLINSLHNINIPYIQEQIISAITSISSNCDFKQYYQQFINDLKHIIVSAHTAEYVSLRKKSIECLGIVAHNVGSEIFINDANEILNILLGKGALAGDDPATDDILQTCVNICKILAKQFLPYLDYIYPTLKSSIMKDLDFILTEGELGSTGPTDDDRLQLTIGGQQVEINLNTSGIESKLNAIHMIKELALSLDLDFYKYAIDIFEHLLPWVSFKFFREMRNFSTLAITSLFDLIARYNKRDNLEVTYKCLQLSVDTIYKQVLLEKDAEVLSNLFESLSTIVEYCFKSGGLNANGTFNDPVVVPPIEFCTNLINNLMKRASDSLQKRLERRSEFEANQKDEEAEEDYINFLETENAIMLAIVDAIGFCFKIHKQQLFPLFHQICHPFFSSILATENDDDGLIMHCVCIYLDIIEFIIPEGQIYVNDIVKIISTHAQSEEARLRQCCIFGLGIIAEKYPDIIKQNPTGYIQIVLNSLNNCKEDMESFGLSFENGISTLYRFIKYIDTLSNNSELWDVWFNSLPLVRDETEAMMNHKIFVQLYGSNSPVTCGNPQRKRHSYEILLRALIDNEDSEGETVMLSDDETKVAISTLIKAIIPTDIAVLKEIIATYDEDDQKKLMKYLS